MATTPLKKKTSRKRIYIAVGAVALLVVGYLWWQNRSASSGTVPLSTGAPTDQTPAADSSGGGSGTADQTPTGPDEATQLLTTLSGENQSLLAGLLASQQGLASLLGQSIGAPAAAPATADNAAPATAQVSEPSGPSTASPTIAQSAPAAVQQAAQVADVATSTGPVSAPSPSIYSQAETEAAQIQLSQTAPLAGGSLTSSAVKKPATNAYNNPGVKANIH